MQNNLLDYLKWRGDLTFMQDELNEVDSAIFSRIAYLPFSQEQNNMSLKDFSEREITNLKTQDKELLKLLGNSKRFKNVILTNYESVINKDKTEQFAAITFIVNDETVFVSFCGTIDSIIGWHENFDMFYKKEISGQISSVNYLENVINSFNGKIYVGGHSKGGNLAIYSSSSLKLDLQKRIIKIFNFDGPGFNEDFLKSNGYINMISKINTLVPQTTIVSTFFGRKEAEKVIKSFNKGIMEHNLYSWSVNANCFTEEKTRDKNSLTIEKIINEWLKETTKEEREEFTNYLFQIMDATNSTVFKDLGINSIKHVDDISKTYKSIPKNKRQEMKNILRLILSISTNNVLENIKKSLNINV